MDVGVGWEKVDVCYLLVSHLGFKAEKGGDWERCINPRAGSNLLSLYLITSSWYAQTTTSWNDLDE